MDILEAAMGGAKKTRIGQRANLNPDMLNKHFLPLVKGGLIAKYKNPDGDDLYRTTDEGRALLKMGRAFYGLLSKKLRAT